MTGIFGKDSSQVGPDDGSRVALADRFGPSSQDRRPTRVVAARISLRQRLLELWRSRELLVVLVRTQLRIKYKGSVLGFMWSMLNPALVLIVYYVVFQIVLKNGIPYFAVFLFCGLLVWNLFSVAVQEATSIVVSNGGIVKKVAFPREILALASVGAAFVFFMLQSVVLVIFLVGFRYMPDFTYLPVLLLGLLVLLVFTAALGVFFSAVNVYLRDTRHLVEVVMLAWFWGVPIVYAYQGISTRLAQHHLAWMNWLLLADPITPVVLAFQRCIYAKVTVHSTLPPHALSPMLPPNGIGWYAAILGALLVASTALFLGALVVFGRLEGNFAEEL
ncbi:MAG: ABC transporter permease [Actinobacteria bacterium]|nr:ABC transporter permease [Actinomycetota bacterium]